MDQRIADYIRDHRGKYTREALTQQLIDSGYTREAIDATWAALDTPDPDDTAGEGFWGRFFMILVGINVAVIVLVGLGDRPVFSSDRDRAPGDLGRRAGDRGPDRMGDRRSGRTDPDGEDDGNGHRHRHPARVCAADRWQLLRAAERSWTAAADGTLRPVT